jgi:uncharacterized protein (TIRG00374 family)
MTPPAKKRFYNIIRIAVCLAALLIVIQGVTINDHVALRDGEGELVGTVQGDSAEADPIVVEIAGGETRNVPRARIAVDEDGALRISYGLKTAWRLSKKSFLLLAVLIHLPVVLPQALRFQWVLGAQNIAVGYWECLKLSLAGNFLNFATPLGSHAGDVFKAYFVSLHTDHKTEAVTTVLLDRIIGLTTLLTVVAAITMLSPRNSRLGAFRLWVLLALGIGGLAVLVYLSPFVRRHLVPRAWLERLPMFDQLQRIDKTARVLIGKTSTLVGAFLLTVFLQAMAIGAYFTVAVALAMTANLGNVLEYYTYFYTGVLVQTLPGPPQGLGTVELAYRFFLAPFGSPSQIVCVAFAIRLVVLVVALPGLLVTLTGSYRPQAVSTADKADDLKDLPPLSPVP